MYQSFVPLLRKQGVPYSEIVALLKRAGINLWTFAECPETYRLSAYRPEFHQDVTFHVFK